MNFASIFSLIMQALPSVLSIVQNVSNDRKAGSGLSVIQTIQKNAPDVINVLGQIGGALFPNVPPAQHAEAAATALDPATVVKIQTALNARGANPQLTVDGAYGPKTIAAVEAFQKANNLAVDQWAGPLTQQALGVA